MEARRGRRCRGTVVVIAAVVASTFAWNASTAVAGEGDPYVTDPGVSGGAIWQLDGDTGRVSLVASGTFNNPVALEFAPNGDLLVADAGAAVIWQVDLPSGAVSAFSYPPFPHSPNGLALTPQGDLLVTTDLTTGPGAALLNLDLQNGTYTTLHSGAPFQSLGGVTTSPSGGIWVTDGLPAVFSINGATGAATSLAQGPPFGDPAGIGVLFSGLLAVADQANTASGVTPIVWYVDPSNGLRTPLAQNGGMVAPTGLTIQPPSCLGKPATIYGSTGKDKLNGTSRRDVIDGLGGADRIKGAGGNDLLCGGPGNDVISGGGGKDRVVSGKGRDRVSCTPFDPRCG